MVKAVVGVELLGIDARPISGRPNRHPGRQAVVAGAAPRFAIEQIMAKILLVGEAVERKQPVGVRDQRLVPF